MKITVTSLQSHCQRRKSKAHYGISIESFMLGRKALFHELLTLLVPIREEERKLTFYLNFYFHASLYWFKKFCEGLKGLH